MVRFSAPLVSVRTLVSCCILIASCTLHTCAADGLEVIFAVNCGGGDFTDSSGIHYQSDPLFDVGTASDFGRQLEISRVNVADRPLYQTERYHHTTFGYDLPSLTDGHYILVLKFSEVYFNAADQKVFDVVLNGEHTVVQDLDIFSRVGRGVAHDELVSFSVHDGHVTCMGETSDIEQGVIRVDFVKGYRDNPKVNAILLVKGQLPDVPQLPPLVSESEDIVDIDNEDTSHQHSATASNRRAPPSGPRVQDPYTQQETATTAMLPVFITLGACVPLLLCICRL